MKLRSSVLLTSRLARMFVFGREISVVATYGSLLLAALTLLLMHPSRMSAQGAVFSSAYIGTGNQDSNVGLNTSKTYLNNVDLWGGGNTTTINGVPFIQTTALSGDTWSLAGQTNVFSDFNSGVDSLGVTDSLGYLLSNFNYGGNPAVFTLDRLVPGQTYVLTFYNAAFGGAGGRVQTIASSSGASTVFDENLNGGGANVLRYSFLASDTSEALMFSPQQSGNTFHFYGFSTEQVFNNTWTGTGSTMNWNDAGNWSVVIPSYTGANASFPAQNSQTAVSLDQDTTVGHIQFGGTNSWTITGAKILTLQTDDPGGVSVLSTLAGTHIITTPVSMQSSAAKLGNGTLVLSNAVASHGNAMTVSSGTLQFGDGLNNSVSVPFDGNITNNAALVFSHPNAQTYSGTISGSGNLIKRGGGILTLTGRQHTYTGATTINGGTLQLARAYSVPVTNAGFESPVYDPPGYSQANWAYLTNSTDALPGGWAFSSYAGIAHNGSPWVNVAPEGTQVAFLQSSGGSEGSMVQTVTSTADQTYTISFQAANRPGFAADGIVLTVDGVYTAASWDYSQFDNGGSFKGYSATVELTPGTHTLTFSGSDGLGTTDVATAIDAVQINVASLLPANSAVSLTAGGTVLDLGGNYQTVGSLAGVAGAAVLNDGSLTAGGDNSNQTFAGAISGAGSFTKAGNGVQVLSGNNTYSGGTAVSGGTLQLASVTALPSGASTGNVTVNNGTLDLCGHSAAARALNGAGTIDSTVSGAAPVLTIGNGDVSGVFSGVLRNSAGTMAVVKTGSGSQTLSGASTYGGGTAINDGTVVALANSALGSGQVNVASGGTLQVGTNGLVGSYYDIFPVSGGTPSQNPNFVDLPTLTAHLAGRTTSLVQNTTVPSSTNNNGANFDFGSDGSGFPGKYATVSGNSAVEFEATFTGLIRIPTSGVYAFDTTSDDGSMMFIDGNTVVNNNYFQGVASRSGTATLTAGIHSITIGYYQGSGGDGLYARIIAGPTGANIPSGGERLPQSWLVPNETDLTISSLKGAGNVQLIGGNLITGFDNSSTTFGGTISGGFGLIKAGSGTMSLTAVSAYSGGTKLQAGTLNFADGALGSGPIAFGGGILQYAAGNSQDVSGQIHNSTAPVTIDTNSGNVSYSLPLDASNTAGLTKLGPGMLSLAAVNSYSGPTVVKGGTLKLLPAVIGLTDQTFTSDAAALIGTTSPFGSGNYTVALAFNQTGNASGSNVNINGVTFQDTGTTPSGAQWSVANMPGNGASGNFPGGFPVAGDQGTYSLLNHFYYGHYNATTETLTVSGLTPGATYDARLYYRSWENASNDRLANITFDGGTGSPATLTKINEDADANAHYLDYKYTVGLAGTLTVAMTPLADNASWHVYGFSNQLIPNNILPTATDLTIAASSTLDLNGSSQQVAALSDLSGSGGTVTNSSASPAVLTVSSSDSSTNTTFSGTIQDGASVGGVKLVLSGSGTLVLAGSNTYTGGTYVVGGTLIVTNTYGLQDGTSLTVGADAAAIFGTAAAGGSALTASAVSPVPEPGTLVLLAAGAMLLLCRWRRKAMRD